MEFELLSLKDKEKWVSCLKELPINQQDVYFTPGYYQIYEEYGDGEPFCFVFRNGNEIALYPFLQNPIDNSIYQLDKQYYDIQGAYGYNGVVSSCYDPQFIDSFHLSFSEFCTKNNIVAEFTRFHPLLQNYLFSEKHLTVFKDRETVMLDLSKKEEDVWQNDYSKANRNKIRKAEKSNIVITVTDKNEDYDAFHQIYSDTMKGLDATGYYFFDDNYFRNFKLFLDKNQRLFIATFEGKIIGALFMMLYGEYAHIHLSGSIYEYLNLGVNNLIKHEAVKYARSIGAKYFHFGGGNTTNPEDALFKFKANFSNERGAFYIGKKIHNELIYNKLCYIWGEKYPEKKDKYSKFLLKYRMVN